MTGRYAAAGVIGGRVLSLDAYRGLVMLLLISEGFFVGIFPRLFGESPLWTELGSQFSHVPWVGCHLWDLIQPSFMFLVGAAIPFSYALRVQRGESATKIRVHTAYRACVLLLLNILYTSNGKPHTVFDFHSILAQIALSYVFAFGLVGRTRFAQLSIMGAILIGYWIAFILYPAPAPDFDYSSVGLPADWNYMTGLFAHWNKNVNLGTYVDQWFLNLFPRDEAYRYSSTGLQTLNFVPSMVTVGAGIVAGEVLRARNGEPDAVRPFCAWGVGLVSAGLLSGYFLCPIVKAIWTPSWVLLSTGFALLILAFFHRFVDIRGHQAFVFPFLVAGANAITLYMLNGLFKPWLDATLITHLGDASWMLNQTIAFLSLWGIAFWMYRRRIFLKV